MAKRPLKLSIRIPPYARPRNAWRKALHEVISESQKISPVVYKLTDKLELEIKLYIKGSALFVHDVDNRLKDIMDALQGRAGGPKSKRVLKPIISNDNQICRVIIEKFEPPWQSRGLGHLTIRKYRTWHFLRRLSPTRGKIPASGGN